jgi:tetratricopeptide (TPR) repeat protein
LALVAVLAIVFASGFGWYWNSAAKNLKFASQSVNALSELVSETVKPTPSVERARTKVTRAIDQLTDSEDAERVRLAARALLEIASRWEFMTDNYRLKQAEKVEQAIRGLTDARDRFDHARSLDLIGVAHSGIGGADHYERARHSYEDAAKQLQQLLNEAPQPSELEQRLVALYQVHIHLGDLLLSKFGKPAEASKEYQEALCIRILDTDNATYDRMHDIAWAVNKLADVSRDLGADQQAFRLYNEAKDKLDEIGDHLWDDLRWATARAFVLTNIGMGLVKLRKYEEADGAFKNARKIFNDLSKFQPHDIHVMAALAWVEQNIGVMHFKRSIEGDTAEMSHALASFEAVEKQQKKIISLSDIEDWKNGLSYTREIISNIKTNKLDQAEELIAIGQKNPTRLERPIEHGGVRGEESQPPEATCVFK